MKGDLSMETIGEIIKARELISSWRKTGQTIGLVPTMGYFHEGHLELMRRAREASDRVVVSLFVNPAQFGPGEDFERYPRDQKRDQALAREAGVDLLFMPSAAEMYPPGYHTYLEIDPELSGILCGRSRPGHFRGVATVVTKLLNILTPQKAFFGQKDAQQLIIIKTLVRDLNLPVEIVSVPTVREPDGLALSSRNVYLTPEERQKATVLFAALQAAREAVLTRRVQKAAELAAMVREELESEPLARAEYVEVRSAENLSSLDDLKGPILVALAVWFGKTRLIDNLILEVD